MEKISGRKNKVGEMAHAVEMQNLIRRIGWPLFPDEQRGFRIERAARKLGVSKRAAKAYWYQERETIPAEHMDKARSLTGEPVVKDARNELAEITERLSLLEQRIQRIDPEYHSENLEALRQIRRMAGG